MSIKEFLVETTGFEPTDRRASRPPSAYSSRGLERNFTSRRAPRRGYPLRILPLPPGGVSLPHIPLEVVGSIHHITKIGAKSKSRPAPIFGGDDGIRTHDLRSASAALSQLSYVPNTICFPYYSRLSDDLVHKELRIAD